MALYEQVDALGEAILKWADPEDQYRGYTEVRLLLVTSSSKVAQDTSGMELFLFRHGSRKDWPDTLCVFSLLTLCCLS